MYTTTNKCKNLLLKANIDTDSKIDFDVNGKIHSMTFEEIIDIYMKASEESREIFILALEKALNAKDLGVESFFENMGQLLLMTHLSKNLEV